MTLPKITFEKEVRKAEFLNPQRNFEPELQSLEFRKDPLTEGWSRLNKARLERVKQAERETEGFEEVIKDSRETCPFCPENIEEKTPKFPDEFSEDRFRVGSACAFPNLFPFGEFHAVVSLTREHYLSLDEFSPRQIGDGLQAALKYIREVHENNSDVNYTTINWNCLPPSGASIIHPHFQILTDSDPHLRVKELIRRSREYSDRNGSNYWMDLGEIERDRKERFVGGTGPVTWLTSFSPQGNNEVVAVFDGISSVIQLEKKHVRGFSEGLANILEGYDERDVVSFNMTTFSGPNDEDLSEYYLLNAKIASRPYLKPYYTSDVGYMELFHNEAVIETDPEKLALELRGHY